MSYLLTLAGDIGHVSGSTDEELSNVQMLTHVEPCMVFCSYCKRGVQAYVKSLSEPMMACIDFAKPYMSCTWVADNTSMSSAEAQFNELFRDASLSILDLMTVF